MSTSLRRLAKIEAALALLQQKRKVCLFLNTERDWTMHQIEAAAEELITQAIKAGKLDPQQQEPMVCRFWTQAENDAASDRVWNPESWERKREPAPRFEGTYPTEPPKEPRREAIDYPDIGIV
jgi:hypothetical protein